MKTTIRLANPIPVMFREKGMSREEVIGSVTLQSHCGEPEGVPSEAQIDELWPLIDQTGRDRDELRDYDLRQAFVDAYIDAGWRASVYINAMVRHQEAGDAPMLDVKPFEARRMLLRDVHPRCMWPGDAK